MAVLQSFRAARWIRTINLVLQALLFLTLCLGLNYLALNHHLRYDLTKHRRYSLSAETSSYLRKLDQKVTIIITMTEESGNPDVVSALPDVRGLLREYAYETESNPVGRITLEELDVDRERRKSELLGIDQPDCVVLISGENRRVVPLSELYHFSGRARQAFKGEQAITEAVLDVSSHTRKKIYFLTGNGELRPDDVDPVSGLSVLNEELRLRNFQVELLDITAMRSVPEDAALIIAVAPQAVPPFVQEQLRQYLSRGAGRMILHLNPGQPHGLELLLDDWDILVDNNLIVDPAPDALTENGDLIVKFFADHPLTQTIIKNNLPFRVGSARSVRPHPGRTPNNGLIVTTLAATTIHAWGETNYRAIPEYNYGVDLKGTPMMEPKNRLGVAVAAERAQARGDLPFSVPRGRLIVFGSPYVVTNSKIATSGNQSLFFNAVNWAVDRDAQLDIKPRPIERFQLSLSAQELLRLRYSLLLALPGAAALLGLAVYWTRRT